MATNTRLESAFDLSGRVALVTGAAGGIGLAAAQLMGEAGAHVVMADVKNELSAAAADLAATGASCEPLVLDVSKKVDVDAAVADIVARHGRIDVMVNNAGVIDD